MTSEQRQRIEKHGCDLLALYPNAIERDPVKLCKRLKRLESEAHRFALRCCNGPEFASEEEADTIAEGLLAKVSAVLGVGPAIFLNRDARGYALKIRSADLTGHLATDWGGYGLIAPEL